MTASLLASLSLPTSYGRFRSLAHGSCWFLVWSAASQGDGQAASANEGTKRFAIQLADGSEGGFVDKSGEHIQYHMRFMSS